MIGLVLVTHGRLAVEFRSALEHVVGPQKQIEAVTIGPDDDVEQRRKDIIEAVKRVDTGDATVRDDVVTVPLRPDLPDAGYVVTYRIISADSHPVSGAFSFVVGDGELLPAGSVGTGDRIDPGVAVLLPLARWIGYAGMALGVGVPPMTTTTSSVISSSTPSMVAIMTIAPTSMNTAPTEPTTPLVSTARSNVVSPVTRDSRSPGLRSRCRLPAVPTETTAEVPRAASSSSAAVAAGAPMPKPPSRPTRPPVLGSATGRPRLDRSIPSVRSTCWYSERW